MTRVGLTGTGLLVAALAVAGCGGSKELSRKDLIAKADPICRRAHEALTSSKLTPRDLTSVGPGIAAIDRQVSSELSKLTPPASMAADWKVIVDGFRRAGEGLDQVVSVARTSGLSKLSQALIQGEKEFTKGQSVRSITASRNGFVECSKY